MDKTTMTGCNEKNEADPSHQASKCIANPRRGRRKSFKVRFLTVSFTSVALSIVQFGCAIDKRSQTGNGGSNITKVLNSVRCHSSSSSCNQETINDIWNACLANGFQESPGDTRVISSREIDELVKHEIEKPTIIQKTRSTTLGSGVVIDNTEFITKEMPRVIVGYCNGSEYITN